ncbi:MAG: hypothetical protein OEV55_08230 [candidate division Zixibacteria bacterium]|nr:hypothetical protein [candidate division Zixibacteria bacterium]
MVFKPTLESLAIKVEAEYPELKNRLIGALQLYRNLGKNPEGYSIQMIEKIIEQADYVSREINFKEVIDKKPLGKISQLSFGLAGLAIIFILLFQSHFNRSLYLFSHPLTQMEVPQKFFFDISPGDAEVVKYSDVKVGIKTLGQKPPAINFYWKNEGGDWNEEKLNRENIKPSKPLSEDTSSIQSDYDFEYLFKQVKRDLYYFARAEGIRSEEYRLKVVDRPRITNLKLYFNYPPYTRLKPQVLDLNDGNLEVLAGTKVKIEAESNKELVRGSLVFSDSNKIEMKIEGKKATGEILLRKNDSYHIEVEDKSGNKNPEPIEYKITVKDDLYPEVEIIQPGEDRDLTENMQLPLLIRGSDDFGFTRLILIYQLASGEEDEKSLKLHFEERIPGDLLSDYIWDLSDIGLMPGDIIKYRVELYDNDNFSGPKKSVSSSYNLRHPSLEEIIGEIEGQSQEELTNLEKTLAEQKELQKKLNELSRDLLMQNANSEKNKEELGWEKKKELESLLQKQNNLAEKLKELGDEVGKTCAKMEDNSLTSLEISEKIAEIRKLFEEVAPPELKEAMRKLQEALETLDREKVREALENLNLSAEELLKRLEQTIALLKRMQIEQKMENLVKLAESLAREQEEINQEIEKSKKEELSQLSKNEQGLKSKTQELEKNLAELNGLMKQIPLLSPEELAQLLRSIDESGVRGDMEETIQNLQQGKKPESLKSGKVCENKLNQLSQDFKIALEKMRQGDKEKILADMRKSLQDLLYLSTSQESLFEQTKTFQPGEMGLREMAYEEQNLAEGLLQVGNDLRELSHKSFYIGPDLANTLILTYSNMLQAKEKLEQMDGNRSLSYQFESLYNLNQSAKSLLEGMDNVEKSCSGSSEELFQKLQSYCQKQKGINLQTLEFSDLGQYSLEQQVGMARLAAEQEVLRKSLEELNQEMGNRSQILGSLEDIAKEMEKVVADLERLKVDQQTIERQKRIYSRLLDSEKSLTRRDYSERRKAETGEDILRKSPSPLSPDMGALSQKEKERIQRLSSETYPREYEEAIKNYFKSLAEQEKK